MLRLEGGRSMVTAFAQLAAVVRMPRLIHNLGCPWLRCRCRRGGPGALGHRRRAQHCPPGREADAERGHPGELNIYLELLPNKSGASAFSR